MTSDPTSVPEGVTLTWDLDTLRIAFPGGVSVEKTPIPQSGWRVFIALFTIFSPIVMWGAVGMIVRMGGWAAVLERVWFLVLAVLITVTNIVLGLHIMRAQKLSIQTATQVLVELRPHSLRIGSEEILLERIEKVTVDRAGARLWVDGRNRYLLPERSDAERAWLAGLLREALAVRQHAPVAESDQERARLEKLLQRT